MSSAGGTDGLTIVEVVVALLILSAGVLAVAGMTTAVARQTRIAAAAVHQAVLGREFIGRAVAAGWTGTVTGTAGDTLTRGGARWVVLLEVTRSSSLKQVRVTVTGPSALPPRTFVVELAAPESPAGS